MNEWLMGFRGLLVFRDGGADGGFEHDCGVVRGVG